MSIKETDASEVTPARSGLSTANRLTSSFTLGHDLLWHIFSINASMEDQSEDDVAAINTLRRSSQVCSSWRDFIIDSPSLWSRVVNFDWLHQEDWRKEVMCRTGHSDLFVRGGTIYQLSHIGDTVVSILENNWSRVRSLDLDFDDEDNSEILRHDSNLWRLLKKPPDILELFRLVLANHDEDEFIMSPPNFSIFGNKAPSLRTFIAPNIRFDMRASWMSSIRHLALTTPTPAHELLEVLTQMPRLELLEDHGLQAITHGDPNQMRKVSLPQLHRFNFNVRLDASPYIAFLAHIEPVRGRLLLLNCNPYTCTMSLKEQDITTASQVLSTYSKHIALSTSTEINLHVRRRTFHFSARLPTRQFFSFSLIYSFDLSERVGTEFWNALDIPSAPQAQRLGLYLQENLGVLHSDRKFTEFITTVGPVAILETTPQTLQFLLRLPGEVLKFAFPIVQTVLIKEWTAFIPVNDVTPLHDFLAFRSASGRPISCLLMEITHGDLDLKSFEKFAGLKVVVYRYGEGGEEYVCGGGRPEALFFEGRP